jgi:uncharacterized protein (DUF885 family)
MRLAVIVSLTIAVWACRPAPEAPRPAAPEPADARVRALADAYVDGYLTRFPEQVTLYGIVGRPQDRLTDNSLAALTKWQAQEDRWLADVRGIDAATIQEAPLKATLAILREALESAVAARVCRNEL